MSSLFLCSVYILMLTCTFTWAAQNFVSVTDCPKDANEWELRSKMKNCYGETPDYLCAPIENMLGRYGEICTIGRWIPENECVVLNKQTHNLDSVDCKADTGCPSQTYLSSEVWRYKICFQNFYGITKTLADKTTQAIINVDARTTSSQTEAKVQENTTLIIFEPDAEPGDSGLIIGVVLTILLILIVVFILDKRFKWGLMIRLRSCVPGRNNSSTDQTRNRERQEDDTENSLLDTNDTYIEPNTTLQIVDGFELNPECQVEDGVVMTKAIKSVLEILGRENIVVVIGALGTGKSTCLKYIESHYRRNQWKVSRKENESITHLDLNVDGNKKLFCCDNLFGVYNRGNFAGTDEIIKVLENIEQKVNHELKVVFALHDHVYEELQKIHPIRVFQNKRVVVDFNELSDEEMLLILNDQREHGHCANDPKCWFRNIDFELVKNTLQENPGKLGDPILTLLYSNRHDIFIKREATQNVVKELCTIFQNMLEHTPDLFNVLLYVMFVKTHSLDKNVEEWASELGGLNSITVKKNVSHLDAFLFVEANGSRIEIKHELLGFALFKCCANNSKYMPLLLKHCEFKMIEEIIRPVPPSNKKEPVSSPNQSEFCVILKKEMYDVLSSRIQGEHLFHQIKFHPLLKDSKLRYSLYSMTNIDHRDRKILVVKKKNRKDKYSTEK